MKFEELDWVDHGELIPGIRHRQALVFFKNGYGASIVSGVYPYGDKKYPYELATVKEQSTGFTFATILGECYIYPKLDEQMVQDFLDEIESYTECEEETLEKN